ncbi:MAG: hypothetical protein WEB31_01315 [Chthoniobacterales bacterium]
MTPHPLETMLLAWIRSPDTRSPGEVLPELHAFHFRRNAAYRAFCRNLGVPEQVADWRQIPCVPQDAFKHADLRSFPVEETTKTFRTSGTTGEGFGRHHFRTLEIYEAAVREGWRHAGLPAGPFLVIAPHPDEAPHSSLSHMLATLAPRETFIAPGGEIDFDRLPAATTSVCLLGTALGFLQLCEQLGDQRLELPAGSTAMETGGYKGSGRHISRTDLYGKISQVLGIAPEDIINEYGMTELSSQFYARGPCGRHHGPPWARAIVADPVTLQEVGEGETGILLVYDAANVGSVTGIRTQDLAIKRDGAFELLGRDPAALPRGCSRAADEWLGR